MREGATAVGESLVCHRRSKLNLFVFSAVSSCVVFSRVIVDIFAISAIVEVFLF